MGPKRKNMTKCFQTVALSLLLATVPAGMGLTESPEGSSPTVESAAVSESIVTPEPLSPPTGPQGLAYGGTRAEYLAQIEAIDPTAWLLRFGQVEKRPRITPAP